METHLYPESHRKRLNSNQVCGVTVAPFNVATFDEQMLNGTRQRGITACFAFFYGKKDFYMVIFTFPT